MYSDLHCHLVYSAFSSQRVPYRQNGSSLSGDISIGPESVAWQATASRSPSQDVRHWDRQAVVICKNCRQARSLKQILSTSSSVKSSSADHRAAWCAWRQGSPWYGILQHAAGRANIAMKQAVPLQSQLNAVSEQIKQLADVITHLGK